LSRGARRGIKNRRLRGRSNESTVAERQMIAETDKDRGKDKGKGRQRKAKKAKEGKSQKKALRRWRSQMDL
jgi:hypothetical protein